MFFYKFCVTKKCIPYLEFIKELPVAKAGKVLKRELQEKALNIMKEGKEKKG